MMYFNTSSCFSVYSQLYRECIIFGYTRTLQGLELYVCGLGLGPCGVTLRLEFCGLRLET